MKFKNLAKSVLGAALGLTLAFGVATPALAGQLGTGAGSITIENATIGESYTIYKIFDTDSTGKGSIVATEAQKNFYEAQGNNPFVFTANTSGTYNVSVGQDQDVISFLRGFVTDVDGVVTVDPDFLAVVDYSEPIEADAVSETFANIPYGYYLVTSSLGSVVTLNSTTPDQTVIDKNQPGGTGFEKTVAGEDEVVEIGEQFTVTLKFTATNYDGETPIDKYTVSDTLPEGMQLVSEQPTIRVGEQQVQPDSYQFNSDANSFSFDITWREGETFKYGSPVEVVVTYDVVLTDAADIQEGITNEAELDWTGNDDGPSKDTETVYTYALAIQKVDEKGKPLGGATFEVTNNGEKVMVSEVEGQPGVYVVDPTSESNVVVSPASGTIVIKGVDNETYTLTETAAPAGYNLLGEPVTVLPTETGKTTITIYFDAEGNVADTETTSSTTVDTTVPVTAEVVVNQAGSMLPSTGGMGTTALYIVGGALVAATGITLVVRRRMNNEA